MHPTNRPSNTSVDNQRTLRNDAWAARPRATHLRTFVACVPPECEVLQGGSAGSLEKILAAVKSQRFPEEAGW